jgi:hypothetical protein
MSKPSIVEVVTYVTGLASVSMSLNLSDLNVAVGIGVTVLNAVVNGVFAYRRDRREQREADARTARRTEPS